MLERKLLLLATFAVAAVPATLLAQVAPPGVPSTQPRPPTVAPTQPRLPVTADPRLAAPPLPTTRPSLQQFQQMLRATRTAEDLRRILANAPVGLRVERLCFVGGSHPARVLCTRRLDAYLKDDLGLSPTDQRLAALGLNDTFDAVGGNGSYGDLVACGGATSSSFTDLLPMRRNRPAGTGDIPVGLGSASGSPASSAQPGTIGRTELGSPSGRQRPTATTMFPVTGTDASALLGACRNRQAAGLRAGVGASAPGDAGWGQSVRAATSAMDAAVAQCRDDDTGMISNPGADGSGTQPAPSQNPTTTPPSSSTQPSNGEAGAGGDPPSKKSAGQALAGVLKTTIAIVDAGMTVGEAGGVVGSCSSTLACAAKATFAALGAAFEGAGLVTDAEAVDAAGKGFDMVGGVIAGVEIAGGAAGAGAVLPLIGVAAGAYAWGSLIGEPMAELLSDDYAKIADAQWERQYGSGAGGGAQRPAGEGGKPTCAQVAARWNRFKAYCSQPGNDWRSYDCMRFVARMNGCADPGLVNPGPEGDYVCTAPCRDAACQAERRRYACELAEKRRGMISRPNPDGAALSCAARFDATLDLESQMRSRICERASGEMGERCALGGPRTGASTSGALPAPRQVSPVLPRTP